MILKDHTELIGSLGYFTNLGIAFAVGDDASAGLINERDCNVSSTDRVVVVIDYMYGCWGRLEGRLSLLLAHWLGRAFLDLLFQ